MPHENKEERKSAAPPPSGGMGKGSPWIVLLVVVAGAFVAILSNTTLNVALPKLMVIFGVEAADVQWVLTAYMLTTGIVIPICGYLGDTFGYKKLYILAIGIFTLGTLLCGFAWSNSALIFFRIVQAIGGGVIMPISMTIIYQTFPREKIGAALGVWGISAMAAPSIGPTLSGYIIDAFSWRMLFFMTFPISLLAMFMAIFLLKESALKPSGFDFWGFFYSTVAALTLLLALSQGQSEGWGSLYITTLFLVAAIAFTLFVMQELTHPTPMLDLRILKILPFSISIVISSLVTIGMFGGVFLTPIFLQNLRGLSPLDTGILLMPQALVMAVMMPISGKLFDRVGPIPLGLVGLGILGIMTYELHSLTLETPLHWLQTVLAIRGIGIGLCMMPIATAGMNAVPEHLVGRASSLQNVIRTVSGSFGIAILTTLMLQRQHFHQGRFTEMVGMNNPTAVETHQLLSAMLQVPGAPESGASAASSMLYGQVVRQAMANGIAETFLLSAIPVFAALPFVLLMGRKRREEKRDHPTPQVAARPTPGAAAAK